MNFAIRSCVLAMAAAALVGSGCGGEEKDGPRDVAQRYLDAKVPEERCSLFAAEWFSSHAEDGVTCEGVQRADIVDVDPADQRIVSVKVDAKTATVTVEPNNPNPGDIGLTSLILVQESGGWGITSAMIGIVEDAAAPSAPESPADGDAGGDAVECGSLQGGGNDIVATGLSCATAITAINMFDSTSQDDGFTAGTFECIRIRSDRTRCTSPEGSFEVSPGD